MESLTRHPASAVAPDTAAPRLPRRPKPAPDAQQAIAPRRPKLRRHIEGAIEPWSQLPDTAVKDIVPLGLDAPAAAPLADADAAVLLKAVDDMRHLAELGELSAVVAHELLNPLAGIAAIAEVLCESFDLADDRCESMQIILTEVGRLNALARNLLDFARTREPQPLPTDIADDVLCVVRLAEPDATRAGVTLATEAPDLCTPVLADSELIQRAFTHLITNAIEAMSQGGTLTIRTLEPDVASEYVCVEFTDTGGGIDPAVLPRIFEPFVTTRANGVGLGLAAARKLVEPQGGHITVANEPGQGACFTVYLRRADQGTD